ncbi:alpha/beta hydrolase [Eudoraea adriatica]|uniref:alpha/beta hydrolase n=1 Tax=Eudoraea adriatica TaxID=446681 RepID=UPI0003827555|nr:alpha/beta hydrolase [Eudoraea adriatica]
MVKLKKAVLFLFSAYLMISAMLYLLQEKLIFLPSKLPADYSYSFTQPFEEIFITAADGAVLNGIHFKREQPEGVIVYFHGNAGDLTRWGDIALFFVEKNYDVIIMDYRTYGKSTGKLSEEALYNDGQLFYEYALEHYTESEITLYGRSLGTGIAARVASENRPFRLILETPFYSLLDLGKSRFPYLPVQWFLKYPFKTHEYISEISCPISFFHGTEDTVVPYNSGLRLFNSVSGHKNSFFTIKGGKHNNLNEFRDYRDGIKEVLSMDHSNRSEDK